MKHSIHIRDKCNSDEYFITSDYESKTVKMMKLNKEKNGVTKKEITTEIIQFTEKDNEKTVDSAIAQSQPRFDTSNTFITLETLIDILTEATSVNNISITSRYKRKLKTDKAQLRYFLKEHLGVDLNDIQLYKNIQEKR